MDRGLKEEAVPGDPSMWVFVIGDLVIFSVYFAVYVVYRQWDHDLFLASRTRLDQNLGAVNTLLLLASSWCVALGVQAGKDGRWTEASRGMVLGGACGALFALLKAHEWTHLLRQGLTLTTDDFFMFYYAFTGVHLLHVLLGLGILVMAWREIRGRAAPRVGLLQSCATYWHMVDLLWIILFALLYLAR